METSGIRLDTKEFQQAMREYMTATRKDAKDVANRTARNFAVKCILRCKKGKGSAAIRSLKSAAWWPKMIAKIISQQAGGAAASKAFQAQWARGEMSKHRKGAFKLDKEEQSYAKYARSLSNKIIARRQNAIHFLKFWFVSIASEMAKYTKGGSATGKRFSGIHPRIIPATDGNPNVKIESSYNYRKRGMKTAKGEEALLQQAMTGGLADTITDMRNYAENLMAKQAQKFSGRAA